MKPLFRTLIVLALCVAPLAADAQDVTVINFDDLAGPCSFSSAAPLRDEYITDGIVFRPLSDLEGGAAVLGECSGVGTPGYSPPNFAAIDPSASLSTGGVPDAMVFEFTGSAPNRVRATVGGTPGSTIFLSCGICPWAVPSCSVTDHVVLGSTASTLEVISNAYTFDLGCEVAGDGAAAGRWIVDDLELEFTSRENPVPALSIHGIVAMIAAIISLGIVSLRRRLI